MSIGRWRSKHQSWLMGMAVDMPAHNNRGSAAQSNRDTEEMEDGTERDSKRIDATRRKLRRVNGPTEQARDSERLEHRSRRREETYASRTSDGLKPAGAWHPAPKAHALALCQWRCHGTVAAAMEDPSSDWPSGCVARYSRGLARYI